MSYTHPAHRGTPPSPRVKKVVDILSYMALGAFLMALWYGA